MRISLMKRLRCFRKDDEGVTLVEYGIALVVAVTVGTAALTALGNKVSGAVGQATAVVP